MRDDDPEIITPSLLLRAYASGVFPMAESAESDSIFWVDPERRGILPLDGLHVSRRLARSFRTGDFEIRIDADFAGVLDACADRPETWINPTIRQLYRDLHRLGHAHSVEIWQDGRAGRRPLRRGARGGLLRREHVQPRPRHLEVRAHRPRRAASGRRLPPARHPVRHRPPRAPRRDRDQPRRLPAPARGRAGPTGRLPRLSRPTTGQLLSLATRPEPSDPTSGAAAHHPDVVSRVVERRERRRRGEHPPGETRRLSRTSRIFRKA